MLLAVVAACSSETIEVPGETVVVEKVVTETVKEVRFPARPSWSRKRLSRPSRSPVRPSPKRSSRR